MRNQNTHTYKYKTRQRRDLADIIAEQGFLHIWSFCLRLFFLSEKVLNDQRRRENGDFDQPKEKSSLDMFLADTTSILEATKRYLKT